MTDNDIIKALECCTIGTFACGKECPYYSNKSNLKVSSCRFELLCEIFDLINRQKAKIERLEKKANTPFANVTFDENKLKEIVDEYVKNIEIDINLAKSEAIKKFAERLKEKKMQSTLDKQICTIEMIDNLVKEMTEVNENE